ncbi:MAG: phenylacetic acid degradation oxidoreductase paaE [Pseudomonadota bacterium]
MTSPTLYPLTIRAIDRSTPDATVVTFDVPDAQAARFRFKPGQHLPLHFVVPGVEGLQRRTYSIASGPGEPLRVGIKRVRGGFISIHAQDALAVGQVIEAEPPAGRFTFVPSETMQRQLLFLAAGSGITPILAMVKSALAQEPLAHVTLVYGNRTRQGSMFAAELEDLKDRYMGRFDLVSVFSRADETDAPLLTGRIDGKMITALNGRAFEVGGLDRVFACGPGTMIKETRDQLMALGLPREKFAHEFFAAGGGAYRTPQPDAAAAPAVAAPAGPEVVAILDGMRTRFTTLPGESVLDGALRAGVKAPFACKGGMCCTCRAKLVEGTAPMTLNYSLEAWEVDAKFVLTCQAVPQGTATVVVDYDAM